MWVTLLTGIGDLELTGVGDLELTGVGRSRVLCFSSVIRLMVYFSGIEGLVKEFVL